MKFSLTSEFREKLRSEINNSNIKFIENVFKDISYVDITELLYEFDSEESKYILGGQGNLWTEFVKTPERAQHMVLPRMTALSEVLWTGSNSVTYKDFYKRLDYLKERYKLLSWNHAPI